MTTTPSAVRRERSLRTRIVLLGVFGLTVGLALGGITLIGALGFALNRTANAEAAKTAQGVVALIREDVLRPPAPVPVAGTDVRVQVVDDRGRVRHSSVGADRLVPMLHPDELSRATAGERVLIDGVRLGIEGPVLVVPAGVDTGDGRLTVLVAKSMDDLYQSANVVRTALLVAFPLLVVVLAIVGWRVVGATLRPVEELRRGAEEITGSGRAGRLPVPASRDEIHRLAVTLNDMLARLDTARARQRAFVADAAHELRSPLASMRVQLEVAQRLPGDTDWPAFADDLMLDADRLSRLVDDLLLLARADDSAEAARRTAPVELGELLTDLAARYPDVAFTAPAEQFWTDGDADALRRAVSNLLDNAGRHARSTVALTIGTDAGRHLIAVTDDGPGIPAADRERVFDRFTRLDDARARDAGGSGLGLAIVREVVRLHHGTITLADATPSGLRAEIRLPVLPE
ncbi:MULTISPECIES: sensor histidine kinase [Catenuloplanes]|uniref:histidine kinase n=1 Tax=Catenuloplanes niger TaxID=587534 RepID=A0AAE4CTK0_9ACTN|nr:ATP-binding protein [Catenuloplanes niger]MDR7325391.1 signal transduction histidine kinase [Catenuloplanes niger]